MVAELLLHVVEDIERFACVGRSFHVDADEGVELASVLQHWTEIGAADIV